MASYISDSDSGSESDSDIPSAEHCDKLCKEFVDVTNTDSAMAMMFLQRNKWSLENALNQYFQKDKTNDGTEEAIQIPDEIQESGECVTRVDSGSGSSKSNSLPKAESSDTKSDVSLSCQVAKDENPFRIRLLSWNIDGLDTNNIQTRTTAVCKIIDELNPDVVFLQEVVPQTLETITNMMNSKYLCISSNNKAYFTMMLLNRSTVMHDSHQVIPFYSSKMGRSILECEANVKGIPFYLMTSHLESTGPHAAERIRQMRKCIEQVRTCSKDKVVIFGGDLNARDKEINKITIPANVYDVWKFCGERKEAQYTWDTLHNDNCQTSGKFKVRCRFDRVYFRPDEKRTVKPVYFELVGLERLSCRRFPSDHWGILTHYNIMS